ncbi:MAG: hypothetical protein V4795_18805 [Pseudomonadota bacterium]
MTLNISTSKNSVETLQGKDDPRVRAFQTKLNTLTKLAKAQFALATETGKKGEGFVPVVAGQAPTPRTEYWLSLYVEWLRSGGRLPGVEPPEELLELFPRREPEAISDDGRETVSGVGTDGVGSTANTLVAAAAGSPLQPATGELIAPPAPAVDDDPASTPATLALVPFDVVAGAADQAPTSAKPMEPQPEAVVAAASGSASFSEPMDFLPPMTTRGAITIGLLLMYIRDLALGAEVLPPKDLLIGPYSRMNSSAFAEVLQTYLSQRTDLTPKALRTASASPDTLRKSLSEGARAFDGPLNAEF